MDINHAIPLFWNLMNIMLILLHFKINKVRRGTSKDQSLNIKHTSADNFCRKSIFFLYRNFIRGKLLICWRTHFEVFVEVDPQLKSDGWFLETGWHLSMENASTSCHPLNVTWINHSFMPFEIFMIGLS